MKNFVQMDLTSTGMQSVMTDMVNFHTCPIGGVDVFSVGVLVADGQLFKFAGDVVRGPGVPLLEIPPYSDALFIC